VYRHDIYKAEIHQTADVPHTISIKGTTQKILVIIAEQKPASGAPD